jgi:hypothetical protein
VLPNLDTPEFNIIPEIKQLRCPLAIIGIINNKVKYLFVGKRDSTPNTAG